MRHRIVDHDSARLQLLADPFGAAQIAAPHIGAQPITAIVRLLDGFRLVAHLHNGQDGAKGLLAHHLHVVGHIDQHGGLVEHPLTAAARHDLRPFQVGILQMFANNFDLAGEGDGAAVVVGVDVGRVANFERGRFSFHRLHKLLIDAFHHIDALHRHAHLPRMVEAGPHAPLGRRFHIGIFQHNERVFAP